MPSGVVFLLFACKLQFRGRYSSGRASVKTKCQVIAVEQSASLLRSSSKRLLEGLCAEKKKPVCTSAWSCVLSNHPGTAKVSRDEFPAKQNDVA